jgi:signal peptidase I
MEKPDSNAGKPLIPTLAWLAVLFLSILLAGLPRVDLPWLVYLLVTLLIIGVELFFVDAIWRKGRKELYLGWKKFTGYALPVFYFVHALPRVTWEKAGLIGEGRATFLFVVTAIATAMGGLVFFIALRPASLAAFGVIKADEVGNRALRKKRGKERQAAGHRRNFLLVILEWVDALAWAAIAVLIVNIFIFQLYVVPTESMVPAFLVGDRPFTLKLAVGPRIPLTEWRLPILRLPQRGDIITIANPRYPENHGVDLKKYASQLVYMLSFTTVNLDSTLPDGTPKSDPLVKRLTGLPGDRLMMVDDQLYVRRQGDADWSPVKEPWARTDLWKEGAPLRSKIQALPMDEKTRAFLTEIDRVKNSADAAALSATMAAELAKAQASLARIGPATLAAWNARQLTRAPSNVAARRDEAVAAAGRGENPFATQGAGSEDLPLALAAASDKAVATALIAYTEGARKAAATPATDAYERGSRVLALLIKANLLARVEEDLALLAASSPIEAFGSDPFLTKLNGEAERYYYYLLRFYDSRNFPAFPSKDGYLGPTQYFAMGDNRYNSLDFRFREATPRPRPLDPADPVPLVYSSLMDPFPLEREFIEGTALFRIWPFTRFGKIE